jgi:hypothetical protein
VTTGDGGDGFYPLPSRNVRLAGLVGIAGALFWPVMLIELANVTQDCIATSCEVDRGSLALIALAPISFALATLGLELRARHTPGMGDLVGDLTLGTSAVLFALSVITGAAGLIGPGLLLLLIGSLIFGIVGYLNGARQRLASAIVAIGAGSLLLFLAVGAESGGTAFETPAILALAMFAIGWGWLGVHLLLARPLPIPERRGA